MVIIKKYKRIRDYKKLKQLLLNEKRWSFGAHESGLNKNECIDLYIFVELCNSDKTIVALDKKNNLLGIIAIDYLKRKKIKQILANIAIKIFCLHLTKEQRNGIYEYYYGTQKAYERKPIQESSITLFMIDTKKRKMGIGKQLLKEAENYLRQKKIRNIGVNTDSCCDYQFYEKNGYRRVFENQFNDDELYFYVKEIL